VQSAYALIQIAATGVAASTPFHTSSRKELSIVPWAAGAAYLLNPFTVATCLARSTLVFTNTAVLTAVAKAVKGDALPATLALAMSGYLSLYPVLLFPALVLLAYDMHPRPKQRTSLANFAAGMTALFLGALGGLLGLSYVITNSWEFLRSTYGVHLMLPDLTPNVGLWWYFFTEMFDSFRDFFLCVFQLHLFIYVAPMCIRLRWGATHNISFGQMLIRELENNRWLRLSLYWVSARCSSRTLQSGTWAFTSPFSHFIAMSSPVSTPSPKIHSLNSYWGRFIVMRYTFFATSTLLYASFLGPAFYHLWIYAGSGNANFFYAITLVWCLAITVMVADGLFAVLRDEWETERPEMRGKDVMQISV
jgi:phosphatidylinositol glycan class U